METELVKKRFMDYYPIGNDYYIKERQINPTTFSVEIYHKIGGSYILSNCVEEKMPDNSLREFLKENYV
jgi:hypothetical protein